MEHCILWHGVYGLRWWSLHDWKSTSLRRVLLLGHTQCGEYLAANNLLLECHYAVYTRQIHLAKCSTQTTDCTWWNYGVHLFFNCGKYAQFLAFLGVLLLWMGHHNRLVLPSHISSYLALVPRSSWPCFRYLYGGLRPWFSSFRQYHDSYY